ncbi:hypothetical protein C8T65DRAFT_744319 [Cerioporus squamosus]|nr:hypothetical protein C8T65DRAFT_744319 [Cerioporus squamosus]
MAQPVPATYAEGIVPCPGDGLDGPAARQALPPFDKPSADVVIRTVDQVDFHVWKCLLGSVSQVFADMFDPMPSAPDTSAPPPFAKSEPRIGEKSVVQVTETSAVFDSLLRTFYPPPNITFSSLDELKSIIAAADKYCMEGVLQVLRDLLLNAYLSEEPLRVYAIGVQYRRLDEFGGVAEAAIRSFLTLSEDDANEYVEELDTLSASAYRRLLSYRRQYLIQLRTALRGLAWLDNGGWTFLHCTSCARGTTSYSLRGNTGQRRYATLWFMSHYQRTGDALGAWPSRKAIEDSSFCDDALKEASRCVVCREVVHEHMRLFMKTLGTEVDRLSSEVAATVVVPH